jgi:hypothetical protein
MKNSSERVCTLIPCGFKGTVSSMFMETYSLNYTSHRSGWFYVHRSVGSAANEWESYSQPIWNMLRAVLDCTLFTLFISSSSFAARTSQDSKRLVFWYLVEHAYEWTKDDDNDIKFWESHLYMDRKSTFLLLI